ncbi:MAG: efflux RND transporter periplasmic adaptor subunit [Rhizobacter sp.]
MTAPDAVHRPPFFRSRQGWAALAATVAIVCTAAWLLRPASTAREGVNPWAGPVPVRTVPVRRETLVLRVSAIGNVTPMNLVTVRPRVDGPLDKVYFDEGQAVKAGQPLALIDPSVYRVRLAQAEGQQAQNAALLANAESDLVLYERLHSQDSIARQQVDKQKALVLQLRGTRQADQAAVDNAKLQLAWTRIDAPISGRAGLRKVDAGNLVTAADTTGLVTIAQTRPITVTFSLPEANIAAVRAAAAGDKALGVQAWDREERTRIAEGRLATFDNQLDTATGTLKLKARFENGDDALFPNQYVKVRLTLGERPDAVTIPGDAVQYGESGPFAYVVKDGKAELRTLSLGITQDDRIEVLKGVGDGEAVVLEGLDRLKDGREIVVVPPAKPASGA